MWVLGLPGAFRPPNFGVTPSLTPPQIAAKIGGDAAPPVPNNNPPPPDFGGFGGQKRQLEDGGKGATGPPNPGRTPRTAGGPPKPRGGGDRGVPNTASFPQTSLRARNWRHRGMVSGIWGSPGWVWGSRGGGGLGVRMFWGGFSSIGLFPGGGAVECPGEVWESPKSIWGPRGGLGWPEGSLDVLEGFHRVWGEV